MASLTRSMGEFERTPGVGDGQGGLACCNSWGRKESDTTERLNRSHVTTQSFALLPVIWYKQSHRIKRENPHKHSEC